MVITRSKASGISKPASVKMTRSEKIDLLKAAEKKLNRACQNVVLLNDKIVHQSRHYHRAKAENQRVFRYNLRVKLAVYEGVRNVFYEYARDKAEEIAELRRELFNQRVTIVSSSDREDSESDEEDSEFYEDDITDDI